MTEVEQWESGEIVDISVSIPSDVRAPRKCDECGKPMWSGYLCEDDLTYYCDKGCLEKELNRVYGVDGWNWHEGTEEKAENEAGGYIDTKDGPLNIFWTEWSEEDIIAE